MANTSHEETHTSSGDSVSLVVDYGDGVQKRFDRVPWSSGASVLDVLDRARSLGPGIEFTFEATFTDRGGQSRGRITSVDGVSAEGQAWAVWVDGEPAGAELADRGQFSDRPGSPLVEPGASVTLRLTEPPPARA